MVIINRCIVYASSKNACKKELFPFLFVTVPCVTIHVLTF